MLLRITDMLDRVLRLLPNWDNPVVGLYSLLGHKHREAFFVLSSVQTAHSMWPTGARSPILAFYIKTQVVNTCLVAVHVTVLVTTYFNIISLSATFPTASTLLPTQAMHCCNPTAELEEQRSSGLLGIWYYMFIVYKIYLATSVCVPAPL